MSLEKFNKLGPLSSKPCQKSIGGEGGKKKLLFYNVHGDLHSPYWNITPYKFCSTL
jgi:hypothetical protein